ncbi:hypothetical protein AB0J21_10505 [Streptomyces sp. NPDC049954]|uniref:hypothetical protein n=1 Tax=Streptomyces sp. NPDC049954 TaxID=3155779 RepID=UPI00342ABE8B
MFDETFSEFRALGDIDEETAARTLLADVRLAAGDPDEAYTILRQAFELIRHRDNADVRDIGRRLIAIDRACSDRDTPTPQPATNRVRFRIRTCECDVCSIS